MQETPRFFRKKIDRSPLLGLFVPVEPPDDDLWRRIVDAVKKGDREEFDRILSETDRRHSGDKDPGES